MSEQLHHRRLRAEIRLEDMPVRRVRAGSTSPSPTNSPSPSAPPASTPPVPIPRSRLGHVAYSGHVGRFFRAKLLVNLPAQVRQGQTLGVVKALGLEFPVQAPCAGWVDSVEVVCGTPVEYGQAVVELRTQG